MIPKIRRGNDVILNIVINSGDTHTFGELKSLETYVTHLKNSYKHTHQPDKTSTNQCCSSNTIDQKLQINSLVTSSSKKSIIVDAIFPADMQYAGGVYCLILQWNEVTDNLVAEKKIVTRLLNIDDDTFELVYDSRDVNRPDNTVNITYTYKTILT